MRDGECVCGGVGRGVGEVESEYINYIAVI